MEVTNIHSVYQDNQQNKYDLFMTWCRDNGVIMPKLEYPARFDQGLLGVKASQTIQHREAFLFVPFKMLITMELAHNHPVIGHVFQENKQIFTKTHDDYEQLTLATFMIYEYQKGKDSFWFPYLNLLPDVEFFCNWKKEELEALDDPELYMESLSYKRDIELEWKEIELLLLSYPQHFSSQVVDKHLFMRIFAQVCSRCFGWGLPTTAMIPMADNHNHSHITVINETIHTQLQKQCAEEHKYFTKDKFMNDYSAAFEESDRDKYGNNITGRFNRQKFNENIKKYSIEKWKQDLSASNNTHLWDLAYKEEDYEEDNDTSEEEDEDDDKFDEEILKKAGLTKEQEKLAEDLVNPRKGFKFFIEQEQSLLARLEKRKKEMIALRLLNEEKFSQQNGVNTGPKIVDLSQEENKNDQSLKSTEYSTAQQSEDQNTSCEIDYDYEDEDFAWYNNQTMINETYFVLVNCERRAFKPGDQVYYCYGKRSNAFLLLNYGFCIADNKYDSYQFRVKLNVNITDNLNDYSQLMADLNDEDEYMCAEQIRLKFDLLNQVLLGYLRTIFKNYYLHKKGSKQQEPILLTKPKDLDFEILVFQKYLGIMEYLKYFKEKQSTLEEDLIILNDLERKDLSYETRFAIKFRSEKKKIIRSNIDLANYILTILKALKDAKDSGLILSEEEFKILYMQKSDLEKEQTLKKWIPSQEYDEEDHYYRRRLQMRGYLKDLAELTGIISTF